MECRRGVPFPSLLNLGGRYPTDWLSSSVRAGETPLRYGAISGKIRTIRERRREASPERNGGGSHYLH